MPLLTTITAAKGYTKVITGTRGLTKTVSSAMGGVTLGALKVERLASTLDPLVWNLGYPPLGDVAIFDGPMLASGTDYTLSGQTVTFIGVVPQDPRAIYMK